MERCPWVEGGCSCEGQLDYIDGAMEIAGKWTGVDDNKITQVFRCNKCKRYFARSFRWELDEHDYSKDNNGE